MMNKIILMLAVTCLLACQRQSEVALVIRRGNIIYDSLSFQSGIPLVPPYVSNGIIGCCFDHMGFQNAANTGMPHGRTHIGYIGHFERLRHGQHTNFPLAFITASFADGSSVYNLIDAKNYKQELDLYSGMLTTQYELFGKTEITALAHQVNPNLFMFHIFREASNPSKNIVLQIECETSKCQNNDSRLLVDSVNLSLSVYDGIAHIRSETNASVTEWLVSCNGAGFEINGSKLIVYLKNGENDLRIFVKRPDCADEKILSESYEDLLESHMSYWHSQWESSWVDFPEDRVQQIWTRMKYYTISCFPSITVKPTVPEGLTANIWGFTFPQDVYYIAENMPRTGDTARALKAIRYWLDILPEVQKYSKRIMGVEGAFYPWTPPFTDWDNFEADGVVGADSYELHNPAYVAAIVWHYFKYTGDTAFLKKYNPIIREVFRFYSNIASKNANGTYDIYHENARGQDEASSTDGKLKNLLCAGYSAEYSAQMLVNASAVTGDSELVSKAFDVMKCGITRNTLLRSNGIYTTYEGDNRPMGSQKHPVQLNPITYLPMYDLVKDSSPVVAAWKNRYDLTGEAKKPFTMGWTLGDFALASCRMRDPLEMKKDIDAVQPCHGADPRWVQFYESSFWQNWHIRKAYYFPMMALYLQAFTDMVVQDWRGYTDIFACILPGWEKQKFSFHGITTLGGAVVSGKWNKGKFTINIMPGNSESIELCVSQDCPVIKVTGQADGPGEFKGNEKVRFWFEGKNNIVLKNK